jgi:hypothetical protein
MIVDMKAACGRAPESAESRPQTRRQNEPPSFNTNIDFEFRDLTFSRSPWARAGFQTRISRRWGGLYETTRPNAISGAGLAGFQCANGFSGHASCTARHGRVIAGMILDGHSPTA